MPAILEEHLGYIADTRRLDRFRDAFGRLIRPGDRVADIGCGAGILGLLGLEAGAGHVWGIDDSDAIELARETMQRAGLADRYTFIRNRSFRAELPERVDLIVCDHVGYFGIDYGVLDLMQDARGRFLKPGGRTIPHRIDLTLALASSTDLRRKADAWAAPEVPAEYHWLREYGVNTKHAHDFAPGDLCSDPALLASLDLSASHGEHLRFSAELTATTDGAVDGLAGWFEAELAPDIRMTNSPLAPDRIDRHQVFLPFDSQITVAAGDILDVTLGFRPGDNLISWEARHRESGTHRRQSTWRSQVLSETHRQGGADRPFAPGPLASARQLVMSYADGARSAREIEQAVLADHPNLLPSPEEIARFVKAELARCSQ